MLSEAQMFVFGTRYRKVYSAMCIAICNYVINHLAIVSSLVELNESALQFLNYKILQ